MALLAGIGKEAKAENSPMGFRCVFDSKSLAWLAEKHTGASSQKANTMYNSKALIDIHERAHRNFGAALLHCREFNDEELNREIPGFGYPTVRLQLHHEIGAEKYWVGVLQGRMDVEDDAPQYPSIDSLETYRQQVFAATVAYLQAASDDEFNTERSMVTWGDRELALVPAHVILRITTHLYSHQGQVAAMCRLLGKPSSGWDFPIR